MSGAQNRERLKLATRWSPVAQMPLDRNICRWCQRPKREIARAERCALEAHHECPHRFVVSDSDAPLLGECDAYRPAITICDAGCADNDMAPFGGFCSECSREFETGKQGATLCHPCDQAEVKRIAETGAVHPYRTYRFSRFGRGGYR